MNWEAIGAIGEIVGAIAVVGTLWYLAAQMRTNTDSVKQASRQATLLGRAEGTRWIAGDPELCSLFWSGSRNPEQLSEQEKQRYILMMAAGIRPVELAFIDFQEGRMNEAMWQPQLETAVFWFSQPGFDMFLEVYGHTVYSEFVDHVKQEIKKRSAD